MSVSTLAVSPTARNDTMGPPPPYDAKPVDIETSHEPAPPGVVEDVVQVVDHKAERALCRKFDFRLLPILALMCTPLFPFVGP